MSEVQQTTTLLSREGQEARLLILIPSLANPEASYCLPITRAHTASTCAVPQLRRRVSLDHKVLHYSSSSYQTRSVMRTPLEHQLR